MRRFKDYIKRGVIIGFILKFSLLIYLRSSIKDYLSIDIDQMHQKMKNTFQVREGMRMLEHTGIIPPRDDEATQCTKFHINVRNSI